MKNIKREFRVTHDSNNYEVFTLQRPNGQDEQFNMHKDRIHYHKTKNYHVTLVQNENENEEGYSKLQIKNTKLAREIYSRVGHPPHKDVKNWFKYNLINNCPLTI